VPGEDIIRAMIRAVRMDLCGPVENALLPSYIGGLLRSSRERMRGFHDLLRQKPFFFFFYFDATTLAESFQTHLSTWSCPGLLSYNLVPSSS
jgi:hypothetical protein